MPTLLDMPVAIEAENPWLDLVAEHLPTAVYQLKLCGIYLPSQAPEQVAKVMKRTRVPATEKDIVTAIVNVICPQNEADILAEQQAYQQQWGDGR